IDRTSHMYWQELELGPDDVADSAVLAAYHTCDEIIQDALALADDHTDVMALSEVGFGPLRSHCSINDAMESAACLDTASDGGIDWPSTRAFEAVQGTHGVNINVSGRYRYGRVSTQDYPVVRADLIDALQEYVNPRTGRPFFSAVRPREE